MTTVLLNVQTKPQNAQAFIWTGQPAEELPKWFLDALISVSVTNGMVLFQLGPNQVRLANVGDYIVNSGGTITSYNPMQFVNLFVIMN